jgi:hypothetical protein
MAKNTITLNEAQLQSLVEECVAEVLNEGLWDQMKAGWQGAKRGFQGQKMLDRGTDDFKQNWDREDLANNSNPWSARPENTADMQAKEAYNRYKAAQQEANKYLNLYNQLTRKYKLNKDGVGQRSTSEKSNLYGTGGIIANKRKKGGKFGGSVVNRDRTNDTRGRGLWG